MKIFKKEIGHLLTNFLGSKKQKNFVKKKIKKKRKKVFSDDFVNERFSNDNYVTEKDIKKTSLFFERLLTLTYFPMEKGGEKRVNKKYIRKLFFFFFFLPEFYYFSETKNCF